MGQIGYNFSERVRRVLAHAREEAAARRHEYVGTEHMLLGIIRENDGVAVAVLEKHGIDLAQLADSIDAQLKTGKVAESTGPDLPYASRSKKALELSMAEARELNHSYVGTEHLLLGLLREEYGIAAQVLVHAGITVETARRETMQLLGTTPREAREAEQAWIAPGVRQGSGRSVAASGPPRSVTEIFIAIRYDDGSDRNERFESTDDALGFIAALHRHHMDR